ncbi:MAG: phage head spike fiber domain-containing protein [Dolichospermum sp.]
MRNVIIFTKRRTLNFLSLLKQRVPTNTGAFEAEVCAKNYLTVFDKAGLLVTPTAYTFNKIYAIKPGDLGDMNFTRSGDSTLRINSNNSISAVAASMPRLSYALGGCPSWLLEPQKTNNFLWSDPSTSPVSGMTINNLSFSANDWNFGLNGKITFDNQNKTRLCAYNNSSISLGAAQYTISFYAKRVDGGAVTFGPGGANNDIAILFQNSSTFSGAVYSSTLVRDGIYRCVITATSTATSTSFGIRKGTGESENVVEISGIQLETASFPTTYIRTSGQIVTRETESISYDGIDNFTNLATNFSWYLELKNNIPFARVTNGSMHIGTATASATGFSFRITNDITTPQRYKIQKVVNGTVTTLYQTIASTGDTTKILFNWYNGQIDLWVNGTRQQTGSAFQIGPSDYIKYLRFNATDRPKNIGAIAFFRDQALTDSESQILTTL